MEVLSQLSLPPLQCSSWHKTSQHNDHFWKEIKAETWSSCLHPQSRAEKEDTYIPSLISSNSPWNDTHIWVFSHLHQSFFFNFSDISTGQPNLDNASLRLYSSAILNCVKLTIKTNCHNWLCSFTRYWNRGEPNNVGDEDCAEFSGDGWNDLSCDKLLFWICKKVSTSSCTTKWKTSSQPLHPKLCQVDEPDSCPSCSCSFSLSFDFRTLIKHPFFSVSVLILYGFGPLLPSNSASWWGRVQIFHGSGLLVAPYLGNLILLPDIGHTQNPCQKRKKRTFSLWCHSCFVPWDLIPSLHIFYPSAQSPPSSPEPFGWCLTFSLWQNTCQKQLQKGGQLLGLTVWGYRFITEVKAWRRSLGISYYNYNQRAEMKTSTQLTFSFFFHLGQQIMKWGLLYLGCVFTSQLSKSRSSLPEIHFSDFRSCWVDNSNHHSKEPSLIGIAHYADEGTQDIIPQVNQWLLDTGIRIPQLPLTKEIPCWVLRKKSSSSLLKCKHIY